MRKRIFLAAFLLSIMFFYTTAADGHIDWFTSWGPGIKRGTILVWKVTEVENENGSAWWWWPNMEVNLSKDTEIEMTWRYVTSDLILIDDQSPQIGIPFISYCRRSYRIGGSPVVDNATHSRSRSLGFLVLPVYMNYSGFLDSGFTAMEGYWWNSFDFPFWDRPASAGGDWNLFDDHESANLTVVGEDADPANEVDGWIHGIGTPTHINGTASDDYVGTQALYAFDVAYNATNGVLNTMKYPTTVTQTLALNATGDPIDYPGPYPAVANNASDLTDGLSKLTIALQTPLTEGWREREAPSGASGFELIVAIAGIAVVVTVISRRKK